MNLVATVGSRFGEPVERLDSPARLRDWLTGVGLTVSASLADEDLARVRSLREHLDELFRSVVVGRRPPAAVLQHINAAAAAAVPQLHTTSGGVALAPTPSGGQAFDQVLALVAADAVRIVAGNERLALRSCHADDCRMLFLAHGRRERRWCSSERCGNRSRVAAHRTRAARLTSR